MNKESTTINLCSYYILPLLKLNTSSFGGKLNFINSYIHEDNIIVKIKDNKITGKYINHPRYVTDYDDDDKYTYIVLDIPTEFHETLELFNKGKYSHFKEQHKDLIKKFSGLSHKVPTSKKGKTQTAIQLLALDRDKDLREYLEEQLNITLSEDAELMSIPDESTYITI